MHARTTQHQTIKSQTVCVRPYVTRDKQCSIRWTYKTQRNHDSQDQFTKFIQNQQSISRQHIIKTSAEVGITFPPARPKKTTQQHYISRTPVPSRRKNVHTKNGTKNSAVTVKMFRFAAVKNAPCECRSSPEVYKYTCTWCGSTALSDHLIRTTSADQVDGDCYRMHNQSPWSSIRWRTLITHVGYFSRLGFVIRTGSCCCCFFTGFYSFKVRL